MIIEEGVVVARAVVMRRTTEERWLIWT